MTVLRWHLLTYLPTVTLLYSVLQNLSLICEITYIFQKLLAMLTKSIPLVLLCLNSVGSGVSSVSFTSVSQSRWKPLGTSSLNLAFPRSPTSVLLCDLSFTGSLPQSFHQDWAGGCCDYTFESPDLWANCTSLFHNLPSFKYFIITIQHGWSNPHQHSWWSVFQS